MIRLDIEDYCTNCTVFEPEVVERPLETKGFDELLIIGDTVVKCTHCKVCKNLEKHFKNS